MDSFLPFHIPTRTTSILLPPKFYQPQMIHTSIMEQLIPEVLNNLLKQEVFTHLKFIISQIK